MFEKSWIWDGAKHETKGCWISLWFCPFSELWRWVWVKKLSASKEWCCDSGKGKKENTSHPLFFYLKHWFSSRLFSGNSGISTINQLVATVGKLESKLRRSWQARVWAVKQSCLSAWGISTQTSQLWMVQLHNFSTLQWFESDIHSVKIVLQNFDFSSFSLASDIW